MTTPSDAKTLVEQAQEIGEHFAQEKLRFQNNPNPQALEQLRVNFLGRKGHMTHLMDGLKNAPKEERPEAGKVINILRKSIEADLAELKEAAIQWQVRQKLGADALDVSLPTDQHKSGSLHPVSILRNTLIKEFRRLGFTIYEGPEVDLDFYNFSALNFKDDHPARDMQDTFFVAGYDKSVMRTHTSNIQIHAMLRSPPPLRGISLGRTYRCDSDMTHTPMFHQIEGFIVDLNITMGDMKGVIDRLLKAVYGGAVETRLRPSYFPFVEPGAEVDLMCLVCMGKGCRTCKQSGWLEVGGLGMIHPNVFEAVGIDSERYSGFAFGFGIDRLAMLKYSLPDLRQLFEGDEEFQRQFPLYT